MIAWEESGSGPPVVLVHGLTEDRRSWDTVVPLLEDDFRCVRVDMPGHGASPDAGDYSVPALAAAVAGAVQEAGIDELPLVVGHSMGAMVATVYGAREPVRAVVNLDQQIRLDSFVTGLAPVRDALRGPGFADVMNMILGSLGMDGLPDDVRRYLVAQHEAARQDVVLGMWATVLDSSAEEVAALIDGFLGAITVPYLEIHGDPPEPDYVDWLTARLPTAALEVWGIGGHYPHLAAPERFAERLRQLDADVA